MFEKYFNKWRIFHSNSITNAKQTTIAFFQKATIVCIHPVVNGAI